MFFRSRGLFSVAVLLCAQLASANVTVLHDGSSPNDIGGAILIHSEIKKGDFAAFKKAADRIKLIVKNAYGPVPLINVELDTPGGDVVEAVQIGRLIHERFMMTLVKPERECASACVFILSAGATRVPTPASHVVIHRPRLDPTYFANLSPEEARIRYNTLLAELRKYYVDEINGSEEVFRLIMSTPSDQARLLTYEELQRFGVAGYDPAWEEYTEARQIKDTGR